jgi:isoleucyl-tRNA synthetase
VLDVWVDAGTASWNSLHFPSRKDLLKEWYPASFILEGKDQVRGWFNLLHIAGIIGLDAPAFKAAYMHGYINDAQGRKMSKSLGNYITPNEVTAKYGVDATRYYMIGAANPGLDMNYNFEDLEAKFKNLLVYWNMHKYALEIPQVADIIPVPVTAFVDLAHEERYVLSKLNSMIAEVTSLFSVYRLNEIPVPIESFLLDLSRTYIQLVRDKVSTGTDDEKTVVASVLLHALRNATIVLAPITPFFSEQLFQNMKDAHPEIFPEESVHLCAWPKTDESLVDKQLEEDFLVAKDAIAAILAGRDKAQLGVRWPVQEVRIECTPVQEEAIRRMISLITLQTNVKEINFEPLDVGFSVEPNSKAIGKEFGRETQIVMKLIEQHNGEVERMLKERLDHVMIENHMITSAYVNVTRKVPDRYQIGEGNLVLAYVDTMRTPALEREGYAREIIRRIQQMRKGAGLVKTNRISVELSTADELLRTAIEEYQSSIAERTGSSRLQLVLTLSQRLEHVATEKIKGIAVAVGFSVVE